MHRPVLAILALLCAAPAWAADLRVITDPPGADVTIDGRQTGLQTPANFTGLPAGPHQVYVRTLCEDVEATVVLVEGSPQEISLAPQLGVGSLSVQVLPAEAEVQIDGKAVRQSLGSAVPVACGSHTVAVSHQGYVPVLLNIDVGLNEDLVLPVELKGAGYATLVVTVAPENAVVELDGYLLGEGDQEVRDIVAGPHMLSVEAQGHMPYTQNVVLADGEFLEIAATLHPVQALPASNAAQVQTSKRQRSRDKGWSALRITGVGLGTAGVGLIAAGAVGYGQTAQAYEGYLARVDQVNNDFATPRSHAEDYYASEVVPARTSAAAMMASGLALLGGGVGLVVAF